MQFLLYPIVYLIKLLLRLILWSCRIEISGLENLVETAARERCILMLWHNRLAIMAEILARYAPDLFYCAFISKSRDGELLAILAESYSKGRTLRVPHNAKHQALSKMISQLKKNEDVMVVTPDGPKGPRYQIKPGIILAAKESDAKIIPVSWSANNFFQLKTWDGFMIPKPFSKILISFGKPEKIENTDFEAETKRLEQHLISIDEAASRTIAGNQ